MSEKNKKKNGMTPKEKETLIGVTAGLGASGAVLYPTIKKLSKMMEENMKKEKRARRARVGGGGGSIASQFGMGKRGAEKMRKSPFELKKGGVVKMRGGGIIAQDRMKPTKIT